MTEAPKLRLYNTLTRSKEDFVPIDPDNVRMYVCGPTVYDFAHIGNARPVIVFDVLFRLLRHLYGEDRVTYVRNITDVDDKINARALRDFGGEIASGALSLNEAIRRVTEKTADQFHADVQALGCLPPSVEPRATDYVLPRSDGKADMMSLIQQLLDRGHAYHAVGAEGAEVLFDTTSMPDYGRLSRRPLDEQQAGARIAVEGHKKNPGDFVLWKQSSSEEPGWEASFRLQDGATVIRGRPGWHIECSAMSAAHLGEVFDIHGGGLDLIFPHHENEIAQSRCAHGTSVMANYWMHNGFLQVEGRKMSKSEGNFVTISELLNTQKFGGRKWPGEVLRLAMLMTHYREPIDFSVRRLEEAEAKLARYRRTIEKWSGGSSSAAALNEGTLLPLLDDMNFPALIRTLDGLDSHASGIRHGVPDREFEAALIVDNTAAADQLKLALVTLGFSPVETVETVSELFQKEVARKIEERLAFIADKNWAEADRIRDELLAQRIQLKDGKDPVTGERVTTWEVKR